MDVLCLLQTGKRQWLFTIHVRRLVDGRMSTCRLITVGTNGHR